MNKHDKCINQAEVLKDVGASGATKKPPAAKIRKQKAIDILNKLKEQQAAVDDENDNSSDSVSNRLQLCEFRA